MAVTLTYKKITNQLHDDTLAHDMANGEQLLQFERTPSDSSEKRHNEFCLQQHAQITGSNPFTWNEHQVLTWLDQKGLMSLRQLPPLHNINGQQLLELTTNQFKKWHSSNQRSKIERLFREISKLQLVSDRYIENGKTTLYDISEMRRRIKIFIDKWDKILWIKHQHEINNEIPNKEAIILGLGLSSETSEIYLEYYQNMKRYKKKDLNELFCNFDVYNDCIIWWYLIITKLKSYPSKALWLIFARIALVTPHKISIRLLQKYQKDLTRFDADELDKVTQKIVIGSGYPICTALRIAKWFMDRAELDVARGNLFMQAAETYIQSAINYASIVESDHLVTILLESKSDIDDKSALDMALEYELTSFIENDTVERITTSIMNDWEFLRPKNKETSFEINPLSIAVIWDKLYHSYRVFYFTPLGTFITTVFLYLVYLVLFTSLSFSKFRVYTYPMDTSERIFWVFNMAYVAHEVIELFFSEGFNKYFSKKSNYFDTIISLVFLTSITIRLAAIYSGPPCEGMIHDVDAEGDPIEFPCWYSTPENTLFTILWGIATITLYLRLCLFCVLSRSLGPMIQMIFNMKDDIITFFEILIIIFLGFVIG